MGKNERGGSAHHQEGSDSQRREALPTDKTNGHMLRSREVILAATCVNTHFTLTRQNILFVVNQPHTVHLF